MTSLRERAARQLEAAANRPQSNIDRLLERVTDEQRADIVDLLCGEPWVPHTVAAKVLTEAFDGQLDRPVHPKQVMEWRRRHDGAAPGAAA